MTAPAALAAPPVVSITSPSDGALLSATDASIEFDATGDGALDVTCTVDGGPAQPCTSPYLVAGLPDGDHTVEVSAIDALFQTGTDSVTFEVDATAPQITIISPTSGQHFVAGIVGLDFGVIEANPGPVDCSVDGGTFNPCASGEVFSGLGEGAHTFEVQSTDLAGHIGTAAVNFTVDQTAPVVSFSVPTNGEHVATGTPEIDFSVTDNAPTTIECSVDGGAFSACSAPYFPDPLPDGNHFVTVLATDPAGNSTSESVSFTVDLVIPWVTVTSPLDSALIDSADVSVDFDIVESNPDVIECEIDSQGSAPCSSPWSLTGLSDGQHTVTVGVSDLAGNYATSTIVFTVDTAGPAVSISSPADGEALMIDSFDVEFSASDANGVSTACQVDGGGYVACSSPYPVSVVGEGVHSVDVRATDGAGNFEVHSISVTVDMTPPNVAISAPLNGAHLDDSGPAIAFSATDANLEAVTCVVDGGSPTACSSPLTLSGLSDGAHTFSVHATDLAGNSASANVSFTVDTIDPSVTIDSPADASFFNTGDVNVEFTTTDANLDSVECSVDGAAFSACASPLELTGLSESEHTVEVRATDLAGNTASDLVTFTVESVPPVVTITSPTPGEYFDSTSVAVSFTATDTNLHQVRCSIDGGSFQPCNSPRTYNSLAQGAHTVSVRATDKSNNVNTESVTFNVDTIDPVVTIASPTAGQHFATTSVEAIFTATDASPLNVECSLDGGTFSACSSPHNYSDLDHGGHEIVVRATDPAGNVTSVSRAFTVDTVAPSVAISSPTPGEFFSVDDVTLTFAATDANLASVECREGASSWQPCTSGYQFIDLAEGVRSLQVRATDQAGNSASASVSVTIDLTDPSVAITSPAAGQHLASASVNVSFTAADTNLTSVECEVDNGGFQPCASPLVLTGLDEGTHTVIVRATDAAGRTTGRSRTFTVDTIAPSVSISSPTAGQFFASTTVPVNFSTTDTNLASVTCSIDGGAFSACTSPRTYVSLSQGSHNVVVRAADQAGNSADASVSFTVDTIDPAVAISYPADGQHVASTDVDVAFTATDANALVVECRLDGGAFAACASPYELLGLSQGSHTVVVRATDPAGNDTEVSRTFTVDTIPPSVSIASPTAGQYFDSSSVSTTFSATDANTVTTTCSVDATPFVPCTSPTGTNGLTEGSHTLVVRAVDPAGNVGEAQVTFYVDTIDPVVSVTAPSQDQHISSTDVAVTFSATDTNALTVECNVDGAGFSTCASPLDLTGLSQGAHSVVVRATDPAGNVTSVTRDFTVDTVAPAVSISSPTAGQFFASTTVAVNFSATDNNLAAVICSIDGGAFSACTSPRNYTGLAQGDHTVVVRATDQAGNATEDDVTFRVDTIAPALAVTSPATGAFIPSTAVDVNFTRSDANLDSVQCRLDGGVFTDCTSPYTLTSLSQGSHTVDVLATDEAGNSTSRSVQFTVDTIAPTVSITSPAEAAFVNSTTVTAAFSAADANALTIECRLDTDDFGGCSNPASVAGVEQGAHTITVRATDPAGNTTSAVRSITVDSIDPSISITAPSASAYLQSADVNVEFSATDTNLKDVECSVDGGGFSACDDSLALSGLSDGAHTVTVRADDLAANDAQESRTFTVDTIDPAVSISAPTAGQFFGGSDPVVRSFGATDANLDTVECRVNGGSYAPCSTGATLNLADGDYTTDVRATDRSGRSTTDSVSFSVDRHEPEITIGSSAAYVNTTTPAINFTGIDGVVSNSFLEYECSVDGGPALACTSPFTPSALSNGAHSVTIGVRDRADNTDSATYSFTVDTIAPAVSVTSPSSGVFFDTDAVTKTFTATDANAGTVQCRLDGGAYSTCTSPRAYTNLSEGLHTSDVRATDLAGNQTTRSVQFTVDTIAPQLSINSPAAGQTVFASDVAVAFSGVDATALSYECSANSGAFGVCGNPFTIGGLSEGGHSARIRATDQAGNTSTSSVGFSVDLTSPDRGEQFGTARPVGKSPLKFTKKRRLIWRDEFDGSSLNRRKWSNQRGTLKFPYTSAYNPKIESAEYSRENVAVRDGRAVLTLKRNSASGDTTKPYSSGMIQSGNHFSFQYGYVEARVLVPKCVGCWPAFWMLNAPVDEEWPPEIDIFEFFNTTKDKRPKVNFHWKAGSRNKKWGSKPYGPRRNYVGGWHTYGLAWTKKSAQVFVDGKPGPIFRNSRALPMKPNYLIFNLALQKGFNPTGERRMMIDYVRVWQ